MKKLVVGCMLMVGLLCPVLASPVLAVGPTLPTLQKYTACDVTGIITTAYSQDFPSATNCPVGYEEPTVKLFVNQQIGSVTVVYSDELDLPTSFGCVRVMGMLLSPCHGNAQPICLISHVAPDTSCSPNELADAQKSAE